MDELFERFIRERRYLNNLSEETLEFYKYSYKAWKRIVGDGSPTKTLLTDFVIGLKQSGVSDTTVNCYIRGMNAFFGWLHENEHLTASLKIKQLKHQPRIMKTFTDAQVKTLIAFKPKTFTERRLYTLLLLLADTGIRINEALTLTRENVDLDNLLIKLIGKGKKERIVPFSLECRKALYKFLSKHKFQLVFCTRHGTKLLYDNCRRDFKKLMTKLKIAGFDGAFHAFRRCFASNYIRQKGNPLVLQRLLGHQSLEMTNKYVKLESEDLSEEHGRTSILSRLR